MGGGHAGHNGLRSIIEHLGTSDFGRVRLGIGRPPAGFRGEVADFVLSAFNATERLAVPELVKKAGDAVLDVGRRGFAAAMNARNARPKPPKKPRVEPAGEGSAAAAPPVPPRGDTGGEGGGSRS
jgi:PTH1 family peptidyl-tRNA hydrolase